MPTNNFNGDYDAMLAEHNRQRKHFQHSTAATICKALDKNSTKAGTTVRIDLLHRNKNFVKVNKYGEVFYRVGYGELIKQHLHGVHPRVVSMIADELVKEGILVLDAG